MDEFKNKTDDTYNYSEMASEVAYPDVKKEAV